MANLRIPLDFKEKNIKRSIFDLSAPKLTTLMQGVETPIKAVRLYPKDNFEIDYNNILDSMPMVGRMLSDFKLRIKVFKCPLANYYSWMDNNSRLTSSQLKNRVHHRIHAATVSSTQSVHIFKTVYIDLVSKHGSTLVDGFFGNVLSPIPVVFGATVRADHKFMKTFGVQPNSVLDYFGLPAGWVSSLQYDNSQPDHPAYTFNADFILSYLDCVRNYLVNNQFDSVPYMITVPNIITINDDFTYEISEDNPTRSFINNLSLESIDGFLKAIRMQDNGANLTSVAYSMSDSSLSTSVLTWLYSLPYGGLFCAQFERDMLTGIMRNVANSEVTINTSDGSFSINEFRFKNRQQLVEDRIGISGGRWRSFLRTIWGSDNDRNMDIPEIVGVTSHNINPKSIISSANTYNETTGEGNSAGQMNGFIASAGLSSYQHKVYTDDHCILLFVASLIPDVVYRSGLGGEIDNLSFDDEYLPQYDQLGFQSVPRYKYNCMPRFQNGVMDVTPYNYSLYTQSVGKNIAFIDMLSDVGRVHGDFSYDQYFETWVLVNDFSEDTLVPNEDGELITYPNPTVSITSYINPLKFQYPFVVQSGKDFNWVFQFGVKLRAVRSRGKWFMPTLGN